MAIYHLEAKVISRGVGRSAVAAAAYMSCSQILNDYDGVQHDYTRKQGLIWQQVFLPDHAPQKWRDRAILWNAVEENEKTKDSRLAREFVVALPIELSKDQWQRLLTEFIQEQFVVDGMCADVAIHDTDGPPKGTSCGRNPHAHIMLTVRPLDERGGWQYKTEKEYLCVRDGEERGFTAAEFKAAQGEGWEKQYPYKDGRKKEYMAPSVAEAQGYERASKYPKSTKYGRQNPISERWNSDEQLVLWRKAWADVSNRYLEQAGRDERIDHRSNADRGLDEQPTIHEGVTARAMEKKGIVSDRCEINRQIRADNALLRELKAQVRKLMAAVRNTIPAIAEAMEKLRGSMIVFKYRLGHIQKGKTKFADALKIYKDDMREYTGLVEKIKTASKERRALLAEKKATSVFNAPKHKALSKRIAELTETLEELRSEKAILLQQLDFPEDVAAKLFRKEIQTLEDGLKKLEASEQKYSTELEDALKQYADLTKQAAEFDAAELYDTRLAIRPDHEREAAKRVRDAYGDKYDYLLMNNSKREVSELLGEAAEERSVQKKLQTFRQEQRPQPQGKVKRYEQER